VRKAWIFRIYFFLWNTRENYWEMIYKIKHFFVKLMKWKSSGVFPLIIGEKNTTMIESAFKSHRPCSNRPKATVIPWRCLVWTSAKRFFSICQLGFILQQYYSYFLKAVSERLNTEVCKTPWRDFKTILTVVKLYVEIRNRYVQMAN